ncbi:MAG TPA: DUF397 domain-containing protein [Streptosporangiaceae bacterium]|nr:DUF397 domain-containing protein [Streptosporangiaceae bacterium]
MTDLSAAVWRKASRSTQSNGGCVEIAANLPGVTVIRDSTQPDAGVHIVSKQAFAAFLAAAKSGKLDGVA